jgi:hypothetical protein
LLQLAQRAESEFLTATPVMLLSHDGFTFTESVPIVVVFTKYDLLFRSKMYELREDEAGLNPKDLHNRAREEAQKGFDVCVKSLHHGAIRYMDSKMPQWAKVSSKSSTCFLFHSVDLSLLSL